MLESVVAGIPRRPVRLLMSRLGAATGSMSDDQSATVHPAALPSSDLLKQVGESHARRSGPGGQHRNKTQTAVILVHAPTGISAEASERRSQAENRTVALHRLRLKLALGQRTPARLGPSGLWQSRTRDRQLLIAAGHPDFPALLAEAFDQLAARRFDAPAAAAVLGVTTTQLLKLFRKSPAAWTELNRLRAAAGLTALR